jgi:hypothetical protein
MFPINRGLPSAERWGKNGVKHHEINGKQEQAMKNGASTIEVVGVTLEKHVCSVAHQNIFGKTPCNKSADSYPETGKLTSKEQHNRGPPTYMYAQ